MDALAERQGLSYHPCLKKSVRCGRFCGGEFMVFFRRGKFFCYVMALALVSLRTYGAANTFELVSDQESVASQMGRVISVRAVALPDAPVIEVSSPDLHTPVLPPVDIVVKWAAKEGAAIDINSLHVYYGRLHLDVTQRILDHADVSVVGLVAKGARLPVGQHRLLVSVADTLGRSGEREISFEVVERK